MFCLRNFDSNVRAKMTCAIEDSSYCKFLSQIVETSSHNSENILIYNLQLSWLPLSCPIKTSLVFQKPETSSTVTQDTNFSCTLYYFSYTMISINNLPLILIELHSLIKLYRVWLNKTKTIHNLNTNHSLRDMDQFFY